MSAQPETVVVRAIRRHLGGEDGMGAGDDPGLGCIVVKNHGSEFSKEGYPDLTVVRPDGLTVYIEVKVPGRTDGPLDNGVSAMQWKWGRRLLARGARWGWATNPQEAENLVFAKDFSISTLFPS